LKTFFVPAFVDTRLEKDTMGNNVSNNPTRLQSLKVVGEVTTVTLDEITGAV
jgi:hypothetical protein